MKSLIVYFAVNGFIAVTSTGSEHSFGTLQNPAQPVEETSMENKQSNIANPNTADHKIQELKSGGNQVLSFSNINGYTSLILTAFDQRKILSQEMITSSSHARFPLSLSK